MMFCVLGLAACQPPAGMMERGPFIVQGGGQIIPPDAKENAYQPSAVWTPQFGRMGSYLRNRHGTIDQYATVEKSAETIFSEDFNRFHADTPAPWALVGKPVIQMRQGSGGGSYLELAAESGGAMHGIECPVPTDAVRGQVIRVRIATWQTSAAAVRYFGAPRLQWLVQAADGHTETITLPMIVRVSPGWERQEFLCYFESSVKDVRLQLVHVDSTAKCGFDDLVVQRVSASQFDWLRFPRESAVNVSPTTQPVSGNLVTNGSYEVGPKGFSVFSEQIWSGRDVYLDRQSWYFDSEAVVGRTSLAVPVGDAPAGVVMGPFDLTPRAGAARPASRYFLAFYARSSASAELEVVWRIAGLPPKTQRFRISPDWARYQHVFLSPAELIEAPASLPYRAELVFRMLTTHNEKPLTYWLDGVSFGTSQSSEGYAAASPVEVGILGPSGDPADLGELLQINESAAIALQIANCHKTPYNGWIAVDVMDAWDRPVWTKALQAAVEPAGLANDSVTLVLPRGYYRIKATAWSEAIGISSILSQDERAFAVIDLTDEVPSDCYFGLAADAGTVSARTTQIGVGWVKTPLDIRWDAASGAKPYAGWQKALQGAHLQDLDVTVEVVGLPREPEARRLLFRRWLNAGGQDVCGVYLSPAEADKIAGAGVEPSPKEAKAWLGMEELKTPVVVVPVRVDAGLLATSRPTSMPSVVHGNRADGFAYRYLLDGDVPEAADAIREQLAVRRAERPEASWWVLDLPARAGSAYSRRPSVNVLPGGPATPAPAEADPVVSAARAVRSVLLQYLIGADHAGVALHAFRAQGTRLETTADALCEYDHSPRPALAAWDWMTKLLNEAACIRWYDKPADVRVIVFEQNGGQIIAAVWRPFGQAAHRLVLPSLASVASVHDVFGGIVADAKTGNDVTLRVNEIVRYVIVPASAREMLLQALDNAEPQL